MTVHEAIKKSTGVRVEYLGDGSNGLYLWFNDHQSIYLGSDEDDEVSNDVSCGKELSEIINVLRSAVVGYQVAIAAIGSKAMD